MELSCRAAEVLLAYARSNACLGGPQRDRFLRAGGSKRPTATGDCPAGAPMVGLDTAGGAITASTEARSSNSSSDIALNSLRVVLLNQVKSQAIFKINLSSCLSPTPHATSGAGPGRRRCPCEGHGSYRGRGLWHLPARNAWSDPGRNSLTDCESVGVSRFAEWSQN